MQVILIWDLIFPGKQSFFLTLAIPLEFSDISTSFNFCLPNDVWQMMLNIFSGVYLPSVYFPWWNHMPIFNFFLSEFQEFFIWSGCKSYTNIWFEIVFFQSIAYLLIFLNIFHIAENINLMKSSLPICSFMKCVFITIIKKFLPSPGK